MSEEPGSAAKLVYDIRMTAMKLGRGWRSLTAQHQQDPSVDIGADATEEASGGSFALSLLFIHFFLVLMYF